MLHVWLLPLLALLAIAVTLSYFAVKYRGGDGVRTNGRCLREEIDGDEDLPPPG